MSEPKKRSRVNLFTPNVYPDPYDVISKEIGQNIVKSVSILQHRKKEYHRALLEKVKKSKSAMRKVKPFEGIRRYERPNLMLYQMASTLPTTSNSKYVDRDIWKRLACRGLESIYHSTFLSLVQEVREEFVKVTHAVGVVCVVKPPDESIKGHEFIAPYKNLGRTLFFPTFCKIVDRLSVRLIPSFPLMRKILALCADLPRCLFSVKVFRGKTYDITELYSIYQEEVVKSTTVIHQWYKHVVERVQQDKSKFPSYLRYNVYCCGSTLMGTFLTLLIRTTVDHLLEVLGNEEEIPRVTMHMCYDKKIALRPSVTDLCELYILLIHNLVTIPNNLPSLESYCCEGHESKIIPIFVTSDLVTTYERRVRNNLAGLFASINSYVESLNTEFSTVYKERARWSEGTDVEGQVEEVLPTQTDITFEEGCTTVELYKTYLDKLTVMIDVEHYLIADLVQLGCRDTLSVTLHNMIHQVAQKLISQHIWLNEDICEQFQMMKIRALSVPETSEDLMELSAYMARATDEYLNDLVEKAELSMTMVIRLLEMTTLTVEHMDLNNRTIAWLDDIQPIFEQNVNMFETLKTDFDDRLQRSITTLSAEIEELFPSVEILNSMDDATCTRSYLQQLEPFITKIKDFDATLSCINKEEVVFKYPLTQISNLKEIKLHVYTFYRLVKVCFLLERNIGAWSFGPFEFLDHSKSEQIIHELNSELLQTLKYYKNRIRQASTEGLRLQFTGVLEDPDPLTHPAPIKLSSKGIQMIKDFRPSLHMMNIMCNDALLQRHWDEMSEISGFDLTPNAGTTLDKLMRAGIMDQIEKYEVISIGAIKERQLLHDLQNMEAEWDSVTFKISTYKNTEIQILIDLDDLYVLLDKHVLKTIALRGSVFVKPYKNEVQRWYKKIQRVNRTLNEWGKVQTAWLHLWPIFSSQEIAIQMPDETKLFNEVKDVISKYIAVIIQEPKVMDTTPQPGFFENVLHCSSMLEKINEGVSVYLEKKRLYFSRLFFLSNAEVLEILSETNDPRRVQPHLQKCFEGIDQLEIDDSLKIRGLLSGEREKICFMNVIDTKAARGCVEKWLVRVETEMFGAVQNQLQLSWLAYQETDRLTWATQWPGQVVLVVSQIFWTSEMHKIFNSESKSDFEDLMIRMRSDLKDTMAFIRSENVSNLVRVTLKSLIVLGVHSNDLSEDFNRKNAINDCEFQWLAQLKYYWDHNCLVKILSATIKYGNEYLGNNERLVVTPLTDRCCRTLIVAQGLHLNGAPMGPTGTGKTETVKDLAKAVAVHCVVFNCSDKLHFKTIGKLIKGVACSGAWACFDDFDRIDLEVVSIVAQQVQCLTQALRSQTAKFVLDGTELHLKPSCFICMTINPGDTSRSQLPDNLKVLFRSVAMMAPDYVMICQVSLYSYGFTDAKRLSVKIVAAHRICSELLSRRNHYDFGMRTVKSVLVACDSMKHKNPDADEDMIVLKSLKDIHQSKLANEDFALFDGVLSDLFPKITLPEVDYSSFTSEILLSCTGRNLQANDGITTKVIQACELMKISQGLILVGEPCSGKTSTLKILADALSRESQMQVVYRFINPKALTIDQLYGGFDSVSNEWWDGVLTAHFRSYATDLSSNRKWIVFDGPVDPVWIENINTVLDDSKKLCLSSGEILFMTPFMSIIFEVVDLTYASPATISRCGVIYMEISPLAWRSRVESWLSSFSSDWKQGYEDYILGIFDWVIPCSLRFINTCCRQLCYSGEINLLRNMMQVMYIVLTEAFNDITKKDDELKYMHSWLQAAFVTGMIWGLGSVLDLSSRNKFDAFVRTLWRGEDQENPYPSVMEKLEISIPEAGIFFDYSYVFKGRGSWKFWPDVAKNVKVDETHHIQQIFIPTADTIKYMHFFEMFIRYGVPILLVGPTGMGKSFYLRDLLVNRLSPDKYEPMFLSFTAKIGANQTQSLILSKLQKYKRGNLGPSKGKLGILFIDDLNMPLKDTYGVQSSIELLRQFFDHKYWYDLKDTTLLYVHEILIIAAMGPPGGSRQDVYARFLRHFSIFSLNEPSSDAISRIYSNILLLGWKNNGFPSDVAQYVQQVVSGTLDVYQSCVTVLLPTPAKTHYVFNLRDFSKILYGCAMLRKESVDNKMIFAKIWVHEVLRVVYDKLIDSDDREWLYTKLRDCVNEHFKEEFDQVFENLQEGGHVTEQSLQRLMFGNYLCAERVEDHLKYEEVTNMETFFNLATNAVDEYNSTHRNRMEIVLFTYALKHLSSICRILSGPRGSALLIGMSGSGRQSLTKIATIMFGYSFFQPQIKSHYGFNEWREDLKSVVTEAGGKGKQSVLLFTEDHLKEEEFLEDIDALLNTGEVSELFQIDEKQEIMEMVCLAAQGGNRNLDINPQTIFSYFTKRTRECLHIILCFNHTDVSFRMRLRLYPSLVNHCTIIWFEDWPEEALERIARNWIQDVNLHEDVKTSVIGACQHIHASAGKVSSDFFLKTNRKTYITSASYLLLVKTFVELINSKRLSLEQNKNRYLKGLEKLQFASEQIAQMESDLKSFQPELKLMTAQAIKMRAQIETETEEVEKASNLVRKDEEIANVQAAEAQALKAECEADLALAIPILEEAIDALNTLKPTDITLVKSMKNPPEPIKLVMAAVCVIKDIKPDRLPDPTTGRKIIDFWGPSKRILGDMNFLQSLKDFDKDHIKPEIMAKIRKDFLLHKDFKPHVVAKASSAAEGLCKWIIAMDMYDTVAKEVAPKKAKLDEAEKTYAATMAVLAEKKEQVAKLEIKLAELKRLLLEATAKQANLQDRVDLCGSKLARANQLVDGLGGEKIKWLETAEKLQNEYDSAPGDVLLACALISYLSAFTMQWRAEAIADWHKFIRESNVPVSSTFNFRSTLGNEVQIENWYISGLPRDACSTENAIIQGNSKRWSLLIDFNCQANLWIKKMEAKNGIRVTKFSDSNYLKIIEQCMESGRPVLIENVGEALESCLDPLLFKLTFVQGTQTVICMDDNIIPYHKHFKLYLTTKLKNPRYRPEVFSKLTIINYALTLSSLEDELLDIVVSKERSDLQEKREDMILQSLQNHVALSNEEDKILTTLSDSKDDILEDEAAIHILNQSKLVSTEIVSKQITVEETEKNIEQFRSLYKPLAVHSARFYYCISNLSSVNPMYQYSLVWFINLYTNSIHSSARSRYLEKRIFYLKENFMYSLYSRICRSLFEEHKLMFSFLLCIRIMSSENKLNEDEYNFLISKEVHVETPSANPCPDWITSATWSKICQLTAVTNFEGFGASFVEQTNSWKKLYDSDDPVSEPLPEPWHTRLTLFQKLLVVKVLRPDKVVVAIAKFVHQELGDKYTEFPSFNILKSFEDSNCIYPLVFLLSPEFDPMYALENFAKSQRFHDKLRSISLGQEQGCIAEAYLRQAQENGFWVCLQNCHLARSWMMSLEKLWENVDVDNTHMDFRLWLTSSPCDEFPLTILENSIKMTNETPTGLKQNLLKSYYNDPLKDDLFFGGCPGKGRSFTRLLYGIAFFHAIIQERKSFGPVGWNIPYDFDESDFYVSVQQLQLTINESSENPFEEIFYLTGECNYGGRVVDKWDRRLMQTLLKDCVNPEVVNDLNYCLSNISDCYNIPRNAEYDYFVEHIISLPEFHPPEVYGLHLNAGMIRDLRVSQSVLASLTLQTEGPGTVDDEDVVVTALANDILLKLPHDFNFVIDEDPLNVLIQETKAFNALLKEIRNSLLALQRAIKGVEVMVPHLEDLQSSLISGKIPTRWRTISYPSLKSLPNYISDLINRLKFIREWCDDGKPKSYWLSALFFPRRFVTAIRLNYSRQNKIEVEQLTFDFEVLKTNVTPCPSDKGVFIYGLYLDGARWDFEHNALAELTPKMFHDYMPLIQLIPMLEVDYNENGRYKCPLYKTSDRRGGLSTTGHSSNYVLPFLLNSREPPSHWVKRSVAMLCQLD